MKVMLAKTVFCMVLLLVLVESGPRLLTPEFATGGIPPVRPVGALSVVS